MLIDSYETPGAENLLLLGRERHSDGAPARRLLITEAGAAALFIAAAGSFAVFASTTRTLSASVLAVTVVAYLDRRARAVPGGQLVDGAHAARVRADAVRPADPVRAPDRRGLLARGSVARGVARAGGADAAAGSDRGQLLRARAGARPGPVRSPEFLVGPLARAAARVRGPDRVRRRRRPRPHLVRRTRPAHRPASDAVAVRHRRLPLVRRAADRGIGGASGPASCCSRCRSSVCSACSRASASSASSTRWR